MTDDPTDDTQTLGRGVLRVGPMRVARVAVDDGDPVLESDGEAAVSVFEPWPDDDVGTLGALSLPPPSRLSASVPGTSRVRLPGGDPQRLRRLHGRVVTVVFDLRRCGQTHVAVRAPWRPWPLARWHVTSPRRRGDHQGDGMAPEALR